MLSPPSSYPLACLAAFDINRCRSLVIAEDEGFASRISKKLSLRGWGLFLHSKNNLEHHEAMNKILKGQEILDGQQK